MIFELSAHKNIKGHQKSSQTKIVLRSVIYIMLCLLQVQLHQSTIFLVTNLTAYSTYTKTYTSPPSAHFRIALCGPHCLDHFSGFVCFKLLEWRNSKYVVIKFSTS